jgi:hypothetical protein
MPFPSFFLVFIRKKELAKIMIFPYDRHGILSNISRLHFCLVVHYIGFDGTTSEVHPWFFIRVGVQCGHNMYAPPKIIIMNQYFFIKTNFLKKKAKLRAIVI